MIGYFFPLFITKVDYINCRPWDFIVRPFVYGGGNAAKLFCQIMTKSKKILQIETYDFIKGFLFSRKRLII